MKFLIFILTFFLICLNITHLLIDILCGYYNISLFWVDFGKYIPITVFLITLSSTIIFLLIKYDKKMMLYLKIFFILFLLFYLFYERADLIGIHIKDIYYEDKRETIIKGENISVEEFSYVCGWGIFSKSYHKIGYKPINFPIFISMGIGSKNSIKYVYNIKEDKIYIQFFNEEGKEIEITSY